MVIHAINSSVDKQNSLRLNKSNNNNQKQVAFKGAPNPVVGLMDFIDKGGYAASFIIQDGIGFVAPRVGKGILRRGELKDENGNPILDENGKPKLEGYNWAYARKEGVREIITGPSAFLIPLGMLSFINKKFGTAHNVKLNYINGFQNSFTDFAKNNFEALKAGTADKGAFYERVFTDVIQKSVNAHLPQAEHMTDEEILKLAKDFSTKQLSIEAVKADKSLTKKERKAKIAEIGSVEDDFMQLKKNKIGGAVNELAVEFSASNGNVKHGSISELLNAMNDYFSDALNNTKKAIKDTTKAENIEDILKTFTNKRMGSRVLTNLGIFAAVAAFYTQIPKLYNLGLKGNPALKGAVSQDQVQTEAMADKPVKDSTAADDVKDTTSFGSKNVAFTGMGSFLEKTGSKVFNNKNAKSISDIFELNGPVISGTAMTALLYGFCIPPRLAHAQDKYDYGEIVVRDLTSFTALLFGAKALARLFSDGFTKLTGLALNKKSMEGRNTLQRIVDYLNPNDTHHSVLTSKQLESKYSNIEQYKGQVNGFIEFIEKSGGNIKKAFSRDKNIKAAVDEIVTKYSGKSFKEASVDEIKNALKTANAEKSKLIKNFYNLFDSNNGLLKKAKTYNSAFGFASTILLVPGLIYWLTNVCEKMTDRRTKQDLGDKQNSANVQGETPENISQIRTSQARVPSERISMAGFLNK